MFDALLVSIMVAGACSGFTPLVLATSATGGAAPLPSDSALTRIRSVCPLLAVAVLLVIDVGPPALAPLAVATEALALANAMRPEDWTVAVVCNAAPLNCAEKMYQPVSNSPFASDTTSHGWKETGSARDSSTTIMLTVSPGWKPVPWK